MYGGLFLHSRIYERCQLFRATLYSEQTLPKKSLFLPILLVYEEKTGDFFVRTCTFLFKKRNSISSYRLYKVKILSFFSFALFLRTKSDESYRKSLVFASTYKNGRQSAKIHSVLLCSPTYNVNYEGTNLHSHNKIKQIILYSRWLQVAIVFLFLAAVAAADTYEKSYGGYGKQHIDYSHVPYYNSDWQVEDKDYYGKELNYGQKEQREHDNTKTNWWVTLPGNAYIKRDDLINAQMHVSHSYGHSGDYKQPEYKSESYKMKEYKADDYKQPDQYKADDYKVEEYKADEYKQDY